MLDALKTKDLKLTDGVKWLFWDQQARIWRIETREKGKRKDTTLFRFDDTVEGFNQAISKLG